MKKLIFKFYVFMSVLSLMASFSSCKKDTEVNQNTDNTPVQTEESLAKIAATVVDVPKLPEQMEIYYSWPSLVNGSNGDVNKAVSHFTKYNIVVLGDGIWKTTHGDRAKTIQIITGLKQKNPGIKIFGYVDVGITNNTQNLSIAQLKKAIDGWKVMGINGIFGDDFGSDYGVDRVRQNQVLDYAHTVGLRFFANAWKVEDVLDGPYCRMGQYDYYLLESFMVGNGQYRNLSELTTRAAVAKILGQKTKTKIATLTTVPGTTIAQMNNTSDFYTLGFYTTLMYNFDAFQFTDANYSASNNKAYFYNFPLVSYGNSFTSQQIDVLSPTLRRRGTNLYNLYISANGSTFGKGYAIKK